MVPGYTRAELEYRIYSPKEEPVLQGSEDFEELPDWVDVGVYGRDSARFAPPELPADLAHKEEIESAMTMYRVVASLPVRPFADLHLEYALEAVAEIAEASEGVVLDVVTRRAFTAEEFGSLAEAEDLDGEIRVLLEEVEASGGDGRARRARSMGMRKFGYADMIVPEVPRGCAAAARWLLEDACRSLIEGEARPGDTFEHEGAEIRISPEEGVGLVLRRVDGGSFEEFLRDVAHEVALVGGEEAEDEALDGEAEAGDEDAGEEAAEGAEAGGDADAGEADDADSSGDPAPGEAPRAAAEVERTVVGGEDIRKLLSPAELRVLVDPEAPVDLIAPVDDDDSTR